MGGWVSGEVEKYMIWLTQPSLTGAKLSLATIVGAILKTIFEYLPWSNIRLLVCWSVCGNFLVILWNFAGQPGFGNIPFMQRKVQNVASWTSGMELLCWSVGRFVIRLVGLYVYGDYLMGTCVEIFDTCTDLHCRGKKMKNKLGLSWAKLSSSWD